MRQIKENTVTGFLSDIGGRQDGVTLLELSIALLVIAVLVTVCVPVLLNCRGKADRVTAEANLKIAGQCLDRLWFQILDRDEKGDAVDSYKDFGPPPELQSEEYRLNGYVSVDARYMSFYETRIKWAELEVGGSSPPIASADISGLALDADYGFTINGVYLAAEAVQSGPEIAKDWSVLPGKVGVVDNKYYWDGGWQENYDNYYLTLLTLEHSGTAHYLTVRQGHIEDYGMFEWKDGKGNPGDGWKDGEKPTDGDNPGGDVVIPPDQVTPPDEVTPPAEPANPGDVTPPEPADNPPAYPIASIRIEPEVINLKSNGDFTIFIEMGMSPGYTVNDLDPMSLVTYGAKAQGYTISSDNKMVVKFDRRELSGVPVGENVQFVVSGRFRDGTEFSGCATVTVTNPPD